MSPAGMPASPRDGGGQEGGKTREGEQLSPAAERELTEYLGTESTTPVVEKPHRTQLPSFPIPRRQKRAGPEGREREPEYQEAAVPPQYVLPMIPVPTAPIAPDPMEWDLEDGTLSVTGEAAAAVETPAPLAAPPLERERGRGRRGRSRTNLGDTWRKTTTSRVCQRPRGRRPLRVRRASLSLRNSESVDRGADRGRVRGFQRVGKNGSPG